MRRRNVRRKVRMSMRHAEMRRTTSRGAEMRPGGMRRAEMRRRCVRSTEMWRAAPAARMSATTGMCPATATAGLRGQSSPRGSAEHDGADAASKLPTGCFRYPSHRDFPLSRAAT